MFIDSVTAALVTAGGVKYSKLAAKET